MENQVNKMFLITAVQIDRRLGISSSEMLHPVTGEETNAETHSQTLDIKLGKRGRKD